MWIRHSWWMSAGTQELCHCENSIQTKYTKNKVPKLTTLNYCPPCSYTELLPALFIPALHFLTSHCFCCSPSSSVMEKVCNASMLCKEWRGSSQTSHHDKEKCLWHRAAMYVSSPGLLCRECGVSPGLVYQKRLNIHCCCIKQLLHGQSSRTLPQIGAAMLRGRRSSQEKRYKLQCHVCNMQSSPTSLN